MIGIGLFFPFHLTLCAIIYSALVLDQGTVYWIRFPAREQLWWNAKKLGIPSIGVEANPMAHFASRIKVDWRSNPIELLDHANRIAETVHAQLIQSGIDDRTIALPYSSPKNFKPVSFRPASFNTTKSNSLPYKN